MRILAMTTTVTTTTRARMMMIMTTLGMMIVVMRLENLEISQRGKRGHLMKMIQAMRI